MPDAYTPNKLGLIEPAAGSYSGTWDQPLFANWQTIDAALGGTTTITLSSSNVTLTIPIFPANPNPPSVATSAQNLRILLNGTLSANVSVNLPASVPGMWIIDNQTAASAFTVTIKTSASGSTGITPPRGYLTYVYSDGTNVKFADQGNVVANIPQAVPPGIISPFAGSTAPSGYLFCDGAAVSRTTYAALFAAISTTWGSGDGSTTFNLPDLRNMFLRGSGASAVGVYEADDFKSHTHTATVTDPGHAHQTALVSSASTGYGLGTSVAGIQGAVFGTNSSTLTDSKTTGVTVSNSSTGGTETRPVNRRVLYIIKT